MKGTKLPIDTVYQIADMLAEGIPIREICFRLDLAHSTVSSINTGVNWAHITGATRNAPLNKRNRKVHTHLTDEQWAEIYKDNRTAPEIGKDYNVSPETISIHRRKYYDQQRSGKSDNGHNHQQETLPVAVQDVHELPGAADQRGFGQGDEGAR